MKRKELTNEVLKKREKKLNIYKKIIIVFDILAIIYLFYLIFTKQFIIMPYVVLTLTNILIFISRPDSL